MAEERSSFSGIDYNASGDNPAPSAGLARSSGRGVAPIPSTELARTGGLQRVTGRTPGVSMVRSNQGGVVPVNRRGNMSQGLQRIDQAVLARTAGSNARSNSRIRSGVETIADFAARSTDGRVATAGRVVGGVTRASYALDDMGIDTKALAAQVRVKVANMKPREGRILAKASRIFAGRGREIDPLVGENVADYTGRLAQAELDDREQINADLAEGDEHTVQVLTETPLAEHVEVIDMVSYDGGNTYQIPTEELETLRDVAREGSGGALEKMTQTEQRDYTNKLEWALDEADENLDLEHRSGQYSRGNVNSVEPNTVPFIVGDDGVVIKGDDAVGLAQYGVEKEAQARIRQAQYQTEENRQAWADSADKGHDIGVDGRLVGSGDQLRQDLRDQRKQRAQARENAVQMSYEEASARAQEALREQMRAQQADLGLGVSGMAAAQALQNQAGGNGNVPPRRVNGAGQATPEPDKDNVGARIDAEAETKEMLPILADQLTKDEINRARNASQFLSKHMAGGTSRHMSQEDLREVLEPLQRQAAQDYMNPPAKDNPFNKKNINKPASEACAQGRMHHDAFAAMMVTTALAPLRNGFDAEDVVAVAGSLAVMWCLSPKFRSYTDDIATKFTAAMRDKTGKKSEKPLKGWFMKTVDERKRAKAISEDIKAGMSAEEARIVNSDPKHAPYTVDSAAMGLVRTSNEAYVAMREPEADVNQISQKYNEVVKGYERDWAHDGLNVEDVHRRAQWIVGNQAQTDPGVLSKYSVTARADVTPYIPTMVKNKGQQISTWDGSWRPPSMPEHSLKHPAMFAPRPPMNAQSHQEFMSDVIHEQMKVKLDKVAAGELGSVQDLNKFIVGVCAGGTVEKEEITNFQSEVSNGAKLSSMLIQNMVDDGYNIEQGRAVHTSAVNNMFVRLREHNQVAFDSFLEQVDGENLMRDIDQAQINFQQTAANLDGGVVIPHVARDYFNMPNSRVPMNGKDAIAKDGSYDHDDQYGKDGNLVVAIDKHKDEFGCSPGATPESGKDAQAEASEAQATKSDKTQATTEQQVAAKSETKVETKEREVPQHTQDVLNAMRQDKDQAQSGASAQGANMEDDAARRRRNERARRNMAAHEAHGGGAGGTNMATSVDSQPQQQADGHESAKKSAVKREQKQAAHVKEETRRTQQTAGVGGRLATAGGERVVESHNNAYDVSGKHDVNQRFDDKNGTTPEQETRQDSNNSRNKAVRNIRVEANQEMIIQEEIAREQERRARQAEKEAKKANTKSKSYDGPDM